MPITSTLTNNPPRLDARDLLIQVLSQLDSALAAVGVKIQQLGDGHAISLNGRMLERGLASTDVFNRALRVAFTAAHSGAHTHGDVHTKAFSFLPPSDTARTWNDSMRRDAAYGALADHKFAANTLGWGDWEFPTATTMEITVFLAKVADDDPGETRFVVSFADATSAFIASVESPDSAAIAADEERPRERMHS